MSEALPPQAARLHLPSNPDLNWLHNRAKEKLHELRTADPTAKLADAQLRIARDHGYASWRKLKAYVDAIRDEGTALRQAVRGGDVATITRILDRHPDLVNATTDRKNDIIPSDAPAMRLIHVAVAENQPVVVKLLLDRGANPNLRNAYGRLPIHDCYELGRDEIFALLIAAGAEIDVVAAAAWNRLDDLQNILRNDPAAANDLTTNLTPLGWIGYHPNRIRAAEILLEHAAVVDRPPYDKHALQPTAAVANAPVLRVLLAHGANPNWHTTDGDTLMHLALRSRVVDDPIEYIQVLLDAGCDPNARNRAGHSALDEAIATRDKQVEDYVTRKTVGTKKHDRVIELLRPRTTTGIRIDATNAAPRSPDNALTNNFADAIRGDIAVVRSMLDRHPELARAAIDGHTMLHHAAGYNRVDAIRLLIEHGADPNARWTGTMHTPLSWAVTNDWPEACRALVDGGATVDLFCAAGMGLLDRVKSFFDDAGQVNPGASISGSSRRRDDGSQVSNVSTNPVEMVSDALYIACRTGRTDVAIYLLERGADPDFRAYMNATCFHWAYFGGGEPRLVEALLAHGGDSNAIYRDRNCTPREFGIMVASSWGWHYYVRRILRIDPSLANIVVNSVTPLYEAAQNGHALAAEQLLAAGADVDKRGYNQNIGLSTPLHVAAFSGADRAPVVRVLLKHGADPNAISSEQGSPLNTALWHNETEIGDLLLAAGATPSFFDLIMLDRLDEVRARLEASPELATTPQPYGSRRPVAYARSSEMRQLFAEFGAKPTIVDCVELNLADDVRAMLDHDPSLVNWRDDRGCTPLHAAASYKRVEIAALLLERGADITITWQPDVTPLVIADRRSSKEIADMIRQRMRE